MPQCFAFISGPATREEAILEHTAEWGPPPPRHYYSAKLWPDPGNFPGYFFEIGCQEIADVYRMAVQWEAGSPPYNSMVTTHDWLYLPGGDLPNPAPEAVEAKFDDFFEDIQAGLAQHTRIVGYRWARWKNDWSGTHPSFRFATRNLVAATAQTSLPQQVAIAVTEETAVRRRWGRFYIPSIGQSSNVAEGRISTPYLNTVGAAAVTMLSTIEDEWEHVTVSKDLEPHFLATEYVRVDNTFDIQRRRRLRSSTVRYRAAVT